MNRLIKFLLFFTISTFISGCKNATSGGGVVQDNPDQQHVINVTFEYGENSSPSAWKNIYVIWIEGKSASYIQNIFICQKLITGGLTGTALPYWKKNIYPDLSANDIDGVTSATIANTDFTASVTIEDSSIKEFTLFFEIDRSFDPNDWFSDQPALLYSAEINLNDNIPEYELQPVGWTPNENTANIIDNTAEGQLQSEMRYITHHKDGSSFGSPDTNSATKMVKKIGVKINSH
jgi:hypothetical protein